MTGGRFWQLWNECQHNVREILLFGISPQEWDRAKRANNGATQTVLEEFGENAKVMHQLMFLTNQELLSDAFKRSDTAAEGRKVLDYLLSYLGDDIDLNKCLAKCDDVSAVNLLLYCDERRVHKIVELMSQENWGRFLRAFSMNEEALRRVMREIWRGTVSFSKVTQHASMQTMERIIQQMNSKKLRYIMREVSLEMLQFMVKSVNVQLKERLLSCSENRRAEVLLGYSQTVSTTILQKLTIEIWQRNLRMMEGDMQRLGKFFKLAETCGQFEECLVAWQSMMKTNNRE